MTQEEFYAACAAIIGVEHTYEDQRPKHLKIDRDTGALYKAPTTANRGGLKSGRMAGNGRFPGVGLVRDFGSVIQVALTNPVASGQFSRYEDALAFLRSVYEKHRTSQG